MVADRLLLGCGMSITTTTATKTRTITRHSLLATRSRLLATRVHLHSLLFLLRQSSVSRFWFTRPPTSQQPTRNAGSGPRAACRRPQ